jgi:hypothetical protein
MADAWEAALELADCHGLPRIMAAHVQALQELLDRGESVRHLAIARLANPTLLDLAEGLDDPPKLVGNGAAALMRHSAAFSPSQTVDCCIWGAHLLGGSDWNDEGPEQRAHHHQDLAATAEHSIHGAFRVKHAFLGCRTPRRPNLRVHSLE